MSTMEINGVPLHPLVVHAAVVFGPLAALAALLYAGVPRWHEQLRWPMLLLALVATGAIVAAYFTGKSFLSSRPVGIQNSPGVLLHQHRAGQLLWVTLAFGAISLGAAWLHQQTGAVRMATKAVLGVSAIAVLAFVVLTGDAGARAVWG
jgi:hypothetical protein